MISYSPLLCLDFYKTAHAEQYPATLHPAHDTAG